MNARTKRLINFQKAKYRDEPTARSNARNLASDLSDDDLAYHRDRLASALRGLRGE